VNKKKHCYQKASYYDNYTSYCKPEDISATIFNYP